jgi:uncharacterized membrane protein YeaQ/YmgE (transglycosylase-associated protein family)
MFHRHGKALALLNGGSRPLRRLGASREDKVMIASILVGLVAGWLAGKLIRGKGFGALADILLGLVGGVVGGWLFAAFGVHPHHLFGALMVSTLGATALVMATRALKGEL